MSANIHDGIHFLNGKEKYLSPSYCESGENFSVSYELIYPSNTWILGLFNEEGYYPDSRIQDEIRKFTSISSGNPKDWTVVKHIIYKKKYVDWLYGQIALYSPTLGLKCYRYKYDTEYHGEILRFKEIPGQEFKFKSAVRPYLRDQKVTLVIE